MLISGENAVPPPKLPEYPKSGMIGFPIVLALVSVVLAVFCQKESRVGKVRQERQERQERQVENGNRALKIASVVSLPRNERTEKITL
ncbi:MAG: hypothetical protein V1928_04200 [Parcubacteria group bacterium]